MLDFLIENYLKPNYPNARIGQPFALHKHVDRIEVARRRSVHHHTLIYIGVSRRDSAPMKICRVTISDGGRLSRRGWITRISSPWS